MARQRIPVDRRGAWRLAIFVVVANLIAELLRAHHTWSDWEIEVLVICWASALLTGSITWLNYVALEPTVRRYWPDLLVSWTRLLGGRFTDPLVGRDILVGIVIAVAACVVSLVFLLSDPQLQPLHSRHTMLSIPLTVGGNFFSAQRAVAMIIFGTFVLAIIRMVVRNQATAAVIATLLFGTVNGLVSNVGWDMLPIVLLQVGLFQFALMRYGMFAAIVALFTYGVASHGLITIDPSRYYFAHGMVRVGVILGLAAFGCVSAMGGWQRMSRPQRF